MPLLSKSQLLTLDATALSDLLRRGETASVDLVEQMLGQIEEHDRKFEHLCTVICTAPRRTLLGHARALDDERAKGSLRGLLHGIPILVKDAFLTKSSLGLGTTAGSYALAGAVSDHNCPAIENLFKAGAIILGKTNMNELCNYRSSSNSQGWSAIGGQTQSAFVPGGFTTDGGPMGHSSPCGSSSGSAVAVAAGYSPLALGTETSGSLVQPPVRAGLFALKPTPGSTLTSGVWPVSSSLDSVGAMARSVRDLATSTPLVLSEDPLEIARLTTTYSHRASLKSFAGLRIGFLDPVEWAFPAGAQRPEDAVTAEVQRAFLSSVALISKHTDTAPVYPVRIPKLSDLEVNGQSASSVVIRYEFPLILEKFLANFKTANVRTLADLVSFNKAHADLELPADHPDQDVLISALQSPPSKEDYGAALQKLDALARRGVLEAMTAAGVDVLAFSMESWIAGMAGAARLPIATMPLGLLTSKSRPLGLGVMAGPGREDLIFQFMGAFESMTPPRPIPERLLQGHAVAASM